MSKIRIKNFGPIKNGLQEDGGWIDIKKVTLFIGNQGSGKSTVAKLISTLTWIEKGMVKSLISPSDPDLNNQFIKHLSYQRIDSYIQDGTEIEYKGHAFDFRFSNMKFEVTVSKENGYLLPKIMYVSAERNFLSVIDRPDKMKNLPAPLFTFLDEYDKARSSYSNGLNIPVGDVTFEYDTLDKIAHITGPGYKLKLSEASSGFQSTVPLYLVTKYLAESIGREEDPSVQEQSIEEQRRLAKQIRAIYEQMLADAVVREALRVLSARYKPACFINVVEEPEQNLFPNSQRKILNELLRYNNLQPGNKLITTTHSPYIINYLTLAIKAYNVRADSKSKGIDREIDQIVPLDALLDPNDLVIYEMSEKDGTIKKLETYKGLPSDENYLNAGLAESNELFAQLLEIQQAQ